MLRMVCVAAHLVEHDGGALPGDTVLPVVVGGVHGGAAEHAGDGAGGVGTVVSDATPGGRGADVTGVVVSQESLDAHKLPNTEKLSAPVCRHDLCIMPATHHVLCGTADSNPQAICSAPRVPVLSVCRSSYRVFHSGVRPDYSLEPAPATAPAPTAPAARAPQLLCND